MRPKAVPMIVPRAAEDRGAAEHHRGDHVELDAGAHVRARGRNTADEDDRGQARDQAGGAVDQQLGAIDLEAGEARRDLVGADRIGGAAEGGEAEDEGGDDEAEDQEPELGRHAEQVARAEHEEPFGIAAHRARLADALGEAAIERQGRRASRSAAAP